MTGTVTRESVVIVGGVEVIAKGIGHCLGEASCADFLLSVSIATGDGSASFIEGIIVAVAGWVPPTVEPEFGPRQLSDRDAGELL